MSFPVSQSRYTSKKAQIQESIQLTNNAKTLQLLEMRADLVSVINSLETVIRNIKSSQEQIAILQELETLEKRKYFLAYFQYLALLYYLYGKLDSLLLYFVL